MPADQSKNELFLSQEFGIDNLDATRTALTTKETVLALSGDVAMDRLAQVAVLTAASILCRLGAYCPRIAVMVPADTTVAPGVPLLPTGAPFARALCQFMTSIQRPGRRSERHYRLAAPGDSFALAFVAGDVRVSAGHVLHAEYERWTGGFAAASRGVNYCGPNPFGALLAGALGAAAISRLLLSPFAASGTTFAPLPDRVVLSAYSYAQPDEPSTEPELPVTGVTLQPLEPLLIVGGGAVASGVAYALACLERVVGTLGCADDDPLDSTNLERHLVSTRTDIGVLKVDRLAGVFGDGRWNGLRLQPHGCRYENLSSRAWRTVVATVDKPEPRRRLQFDLPQILLNGGTVGPEYLVSRHDYGSGPCTECLYPVRPGVVESPAETLAAQTGLDPAEVTSLQATGARLTSGHIAQIIQRGALIFTPDALESARREGIAALSRAACTTATMRPELPVATIGFVAALPGLLLAAELVKEAISRETSTARPPLTADRSVFRADTFGDLAGELECVRPSRHCRCQTDVMRNAYRARWGSASVPVRTGHTNVNNCALEDQ